MPGYAEMAVPHVCQVVHQLNKNTQHFKCKHKTNAPPSKVYNKWQGSPLSTSGDGSTTRAASSLKEVPAVLGIWINLSENSKVMQNFITQQLRGQLLKLYQQTAQECPGITATSFKVLCWPGTMTLTTPGTSNSNAGYMQLGIRPPRKEGKASKTRFLGHGIRCVTDNVT